MIPFYAGVLEWQKERTGKTGEKVMRGQRKGVKEGRLGKKVECFFFYQG